MAQIRANCKKLPIESHKPAYFLAALMYPLFLWSLKHAKLEYTAEENDGALAKADENFDGHVALQKEAFLQPGKHDDARYHGKCRTKFDRVVLSTHLLNSICCAFKMFMAAPVDAAHGGDVGVEPPPRMLKEKRNWCQDFHVPKKIAKNVVECGYHFGDHSEEVWNKLDFASKSHRLPPTNVNIDASQHEAPGLLEAHLPRVEVVDLTSLPRTWLRADQWFSEGDLETNMLATKADVMRFMRALPLANQEFTVEVLRHMGSIILKSTGRWFYWSQTESAKRKLKACLTNANKHKASLYTFITCIVLRELGLGLLAKTVALAGGGRSNYFFLKSLRQIFVQH